MPTHQLKKFTLIELLISLAIATMLFAAMANGLFVLLNIESNQTVTTASNETINYFDLQIANEIKSATSSVINKNKLQLTMPDNTKITYSYSGKAGAPLVYQVKNKKENLIEDIVDFKFQEVNGYIQYELILKGPENKKISIKNAIYPRAINAKKGTLISWEKL